MRGAGEPATGPGSNPPSPAQVVQTVGPDQRVLGATRDANSAARKARLSKARVIRVGTMRYLQVKVRSSASRAKLAIRLRLTSGKVLKATRSVRTNRTVRVMRLSSAVKSVKVSLVR